MLKGIRRLPVGAMRPLVLMALLLLVPLDALGHGVLRRSVPAEGELLDEVPRELRLEFNERIDLEFARLSLVGPEGVAMRLGPLRHVGDSTHIVIAEVSPLSRPGSYTVHWQVTGSDGHPVHGQYGFTIESDASGFARARGMPGMESAPPAAEPRPEPPELTSFDAGSPLYAAVRWLTFTTLVVLIGAASFVFALLPRLRTDGGRPTAETIGRARTRSAWIGLLAAGVLLVAVFLRLFAQSVAMNDPGTALAPARLWAILSRTTWGWAWLLQAAAALVTVGGLIMARRARRAGWWLAGAAVVVLSLTPALSGHAAATSALAVAADAVHVLAAGGWLGTLLLLLVVGIPTFVRDAPSKTAAAAALLRAFSPLALGFAAILALTGVYAAWIHLPDMASLWRSAYGQTLLLKLGALSLVVAAGAYNWKRVTPALERGGDVRPLTRSAGTELVIGVVVLAITAVLVATPPPDADRNVTAGMIQESAGNATDEPIPGIRE